MIYKKTLMISKIMAINVVQQYFVLSDVLAVLYFEWGSLSGMLASAVILMARCLRGSPCWAVFVLCYLCAKSNLDLPVWSCGRFESKGLSWGLPHWTLQNTVKIQNLFFNSCTKKQKQSPQARQRQAHLQGHISHKEDWRCVIQLRSAHQLKMASTTQLIRSAHQFKMAVRWWKWNKVTVGCWRWSENHVWAVSSLSSSSQQAVSFSGGATYMLLMTWSSCWRTAMSMLNHHHHRPTTRLAMYMMLVTWTSCRRTAILNHHHHHHRPTTRSASCIFMSTRGKKESPVGC